MKSEYIKPSVEIWHMQGNLSILSEMSLNNFGIDEYEQGDEETYWDSIDMS